MSYFGKLASAVHEFGLGNACIYFADRVLAQVGGGVYRYQFVAQPVPTRPMLPAGRGQSVAVRLVSGDDPALLQLPLDRKVLAFRKSQGCICFGAFDEGKIIGCLWLSLGPYVEDEVRCRFVPSPAGKCAWDFDVYLSPEHRLGFGFARLWDEANGFLRRHGMIWSMSRISALNRSSLAAHARLGAKPIGTAIFVRLGRGQLAIASKFPWINLSFGTASVPEFVLWPPVAASR